MSVPHHPSLAGTARPLLVAGVGSGITAAGATAGGADLLAVYTTAILRMRNLPSLLAFLPGHDANVMTLEAAPAVVANAARRPVIVGLAAHNPHDDLGRMLDRVEAVGGTGVTNEPFAGLYGRAFNAELERSGCGFSREVALLQAATRRGMLSLGWACDAQQAARLGGCGTPLIGLMLGVTRQYEPEGIDPAVYAIDAMAAAVRREAPETLLVVHGGPLENPEAVAVVLSRCDVDGYVTGSSLERGPVIEAVAARLRTFRAAADDVRKG